MGLALPPPPTQSRSKSFLPLPANPTRQALSEACKMLDIVIKVGESIKSIRFRITDCIQNAHGQDLPHSIYTHNSLNDWWFMPSSPDPRSKRAPGRFKIRAIDKLVVKGSRSQSSLSMGGVLDTEDSFTSQRPAFDNTFTSSSINPPSTMAQPQIPTIPLNLVSKDIELLSPDSHPSLQLSTRLQAKCQVGGVPGPTQQCPRSGK